VARGEEMSQTNGVMAKIKDTGAKIFSQLGGLIFGSAQEQSE